MATHSFLQPCMATTIAYLRPWPYIHPFGYAWPSLYILAMATITYHQPWPLLHLISHGHFLVFMANIAYLQPWSQIETFSHAWPLSCILAMAANTDF